MKSEVAQQLIEINRRFYANFGQAFAATRRRIQPGIGRVLQDLPQFTDICGSWLDLGCGGGQVAEAWAEAGRQGSYLGVDFSLELLTEARQKALAMPSEKLLITYESLDMNPIALSKRFLPASFEGILAFASLHHLPTWDMRLELLKTITLLLKPQGLFIHSEWQFHHSPRLMERVQPWERVGLSAADVDVNDYLLDWRYPLPGQTEQQGLRYVHLYSQEELAELAAAAGFTIVFEFHSDGKEGNLALYQAWKN